MNLKLSKNVNTILKYEPEQLLAHELQLDIAIIQGEFHYAISSGIINRNEHVKIFLYCKNVI